MAKVTAKRGRVLNVEVYTSEDITVQVNGNSIPHKPPLDAEQMKAILGWEEMGDGAKGEHKLRDKEGKKVKLKNVKANRPLRIGVAERYAKEFLRGKWRFNGETFIIDSNGQFQDGQHRGVGLVLAEQLRQKDPAKWKEFIGNKPITLDAIIVRGVNSAADTIDTLNIGQKRSLGDVIYRDHTINNARKGAFSDKELISLSNTLAVSVRLVWLRVVGKAVSDAPHFPHSEALDFLRGHPRITDAVLSIRDLEGDDKLITGFITMGYAAGLYYLMGAAKTNPDLFLEQGTAALDFSLWGKAEEFWGAFAGHKLPAAHPIARAKEIVKAIDSGSAQGREEVIRTILKAWNLWIEGEKSVSKEKVMVEKVMNEEKGVMVMAEAPRVGGIDTDWSMYNLELVTGEEEESQNITEIDPKTGDEIVRRKPKEKKRKGKGAKKHPTGWEVGDTVWVKEGDTKYFGQIVKMHDDSVDVKAQDDGNVYTAAIKELFTDEPKDTLADPEDSLEEMEDESPDEEQAGDEEESEDEE